MTPPVIFNIAYTPYKLGKGASEADRTRHADIRAFYSMTGGSNILKYITTDEKTGLPSNLPEEYTMFQYLQKSTSVFNTQGMLSVKEVEEMRGRLAANKGNIWHGFISLSEECSGKIDSTEKCIELLKKSFPQFYKDAKLKADNIDLMCALHKDRPNHLHIHFVFWEKEPKFRGKDNKLHYRSKGRIEKSAVDQMLVRLTMQTDGKHDQIPLTRQLALEELKKVTVHATQKVTYDELKDELLSLAADIPTKGRTAYASKNMETLRPRIDRIVAMMLQMNPEARKADLEFKTELAKRQTQIEEICKNNHVDPSFITEVKTIAEDYKRRQGNLVIEACKSLRKVAYRKKPERKYKVNDTELKRRKAISVKSDYKQIMNLLKQLEYTDKQFAYDAQGRLAEIEEEIAAENAENSDKSGDRN